MFIDLEPTTVSDWSFDENCVFCCLRRDKVKVIKTLLSLIFLFLSLNNPMQTAFCPPFTDCCLLAGTLDRSQ